MSQTKAAHPVFSPLKDLYNWVLRWADHRHNTKALAVITFVEASFFSSPARPTPSCHGHRPTQAQSGLCTSDDSFFGARRPLRLRHWLWCLASSRAIFFPIYPVPGKVRLGDRSVQGQCFYDDFCGGFQPNSI